MQWKRRRLRMAAALTLGLALVAPGVQALTLADLDGGGSFSVGSLFFSDFDVSAAGDISLDLADYPVQLLSDGFRLSGPLSVLLGDAGTLLISYTVSALDPILVGASVSAAGVAIDAGSQAWVGESLFDAANVPIGALFAYAIDGVGAVPFDSAGFAATSFVNVAKTLHVEGGLFAALPVIDQRFLVVPEPLTLALLALGLGGLAFWGRKHEVPGRQT